MIARIVLRCVARSHGHGKEMAEHVRFTVDTNVDVSFCPPA